MALAAARDFGSDGQLTPEPSVRVEPPTVRGVETSAPPNPLKSARGALPSRDRPIGLSDALGATALVAMIALIGILVILAARRPETAAAAPSLLAGLIASALILFRQWWRTREGNRAARTRLALMLEHDAVTSLPNRLGFLKAAREHSLGSGKAALVCIGLTRLSEVNDNLGEACADQLVREVARRLSAALGQSALTGRVSEDMFAVLISAGGGRVATLLGGQLNQLLSLPVETVAGRLGVGSAIGVSFVTLPLDDPADALRQARLALAGARASGASIALFEPQMDVARRVELEMEAELAAALSAGDLHMLYQPQVNERGALIGVEALIRWDSRTRGAVPPDIFIPIAERCGLGEAIGRFVLDRAFADARRWPDLPVAINISPVQVRKPGFVDMVDDLRRAHGVTASRIELELTEGLLLETNPIVLANLEGLRKLGFQLALDDFGTGYSGLSYLSQFQVDKIKIDRSFVIPLGARSDAAPIIRAITNLSEAIGVKVIAEGVETQLQLDALREAGCKQAQGFHIGRPMPASDIDGLLAPGAALTG